MDRDEVRITLAEALAVALEVANTENNQEARDRYQELARHYDVEQLVRELRHGRGAGSA